MQRINELKKQMLDYQHRMDRQLNLEIARQNSTEDIEYNNRKDFMSNRQESKEFPKKGFPIVIDSIAEEHPIRVFEKESDIDLNNGENWFITDSFENINREIGNWEKMITPDARGIVKELKNKQAEYQEKKKGLSGLDIAVKTPVAKIQTEYPDPNNFGIERLFQKDWLGNKSLLNEAQFQELTELLKNEQSDIMEQNKVPQIEEKMWGNSIEEPTAKEASISPMAHSVSPEGLEMKGRSEEEADKIIVENSSYIKDAAKKFGVNPAILAAAIYTDQRSNGDWIDDISDGILGFYGVDTSIGVAQVKMSTAKKLEELGYMPKIKKGDGGWNIPFFGFVEGSETMARAKALTDPRTSIMYAAAYMKLIQDIWKKDYPSIDGDTAVMSTLYNSRENGSKGPHANPKGSPFGLFARGQYYHMQDLLN